MSDSYSHWPEYSLTLADGSCWILFGMDEAEAEIVARFSEVMGMKPGGGEGRRIGVTFTPIQIGDKIPNEEICLLSPHPSNNVRLYLHFITISQFIVYLAQKNGAILLHGALAKLGEQGVILAGPGGMGKTTASMRLSEPWCSCSDDATLIVRDRVGTYWAHPWPTWSRFLNGEPDGKWEVQQATSLKAIFFLQRASKERIEPVGAGQATGLLMQAIEQVGAHFLPRTKKLQARTLRLEFFEIICTMVRQVPVYFLHLSLTGFFWQEMEKVLD